MKCPELTQVVRPPCPRAEAGTCKLSELFHSCSKYRDRMQGIFNDDAALLLKTSYKKP